MHGKYAIFLSDKMGYGVGEGEEWGRYSVSQEKKNDPDNFMSAKVAL